MPLGTRPDPSGSLKLPSKEAANRVKEYWEERLGALVEMLTAARKRAW